jgi:hypothetical protein
LGALFVITAALLVAFSQGLVRIDEVFALIIMLYGVWTIVLAGIRVMNPDKYGRGAYSTLVMGVLLTAVGGAWEFHIRFENIIISIALILVVIGVLAVASALPSFRQKREPEQTNP